MEFTQCIIETFHVVSCYTCGTRFGINSDMYRCAVRDHNRSVYCPACGHKTCWTGETEAQRIKRKMSAQLERANAHARDMENEAINARNSLRAQKGAVTRLKRRVSAGVCPCCKRTFQDLARHMAGQHPGYEKS